MGFSNTGRSEKGSVKISSVLLVFGASEPGLMMSCRRFRTKTINNMTSTTTIAATPPATGPADEELPLSLDACSRLSSRVFIVVVVLGEVVTEDRLVEDDVVITLVGAAGWLVGVGKRDCEGGCVRGSDDNFVGVELEGDLVGDEDVDIDVDGETVGDSVLIGV